MARRAGTGIYGKSPVVAGGVCFFWWETMSPKFDGMVMCLYCGMICPVEFAAEQRHTCRPVGSFGPYLDPTWRPVQLIIELSRRGGKTGGGWGPGGEPPK